MFNDGTIRDNINFKHNCQIKQKEQIARITYEHGSDMAVKFNGEMFMGEFYFPIGCNPGDCDKFGGYQPEWKNGGEKSLLRSAVGHTKLPNGGKSGGVGFSKIPWNWEILKIFFMSHNVNPVWVDHYEFYDQTKCLDSNQCYGMLKKV